LKFSVLEEEIVEGINITFSQGETNSGEAIIIMTTEQGKKYILNQSRKPEYFSELSDLVGHTIKVKIIQTFDDKKYKVKELQKDGESKLLTLKLPVANINIHYLLNDKRKVSQKDKFENLKKEL